MLARHGARRDRRQAERAEDDSLRGGGNRNPAGGRHREGTANQYRACVTEQNTQGGSILSVCDETVHTGE
ncbi:hypothetical protein SDC9_131187 [bioreactor metagenome]|uniref:Uncharacterized protein n=1 Tax=bioreactor metagenome TaxID=1076179 RepID=A0A645D416_9ZZZZ